jgi:hypothetical protein
MAPELIPEGLWDLIEPLLPQPEPRPTGGRPRLPNCLRIAGLAAASLGQRRTAQQIYTAEIHERHKHWLSGKLSKAGTTIFL